MQKPTYTGLQHKAGHRFGEFCSCCCLPLLPQLACSILATRGPPYTGALYSLYCKLVKINYFYFTDFIDCPSQKTLIMS